jgi:hypothetical protein
MTEDTDAAGYRTVEEDEMGGACSTNGREEEHLEVVGEKARGIEAARKTKT